MRKIESRYEKEKGRKRKQIIIGVSLAVLMIFGVLGFALQGGVVNQGDKNSLDNVFYNGFEFEYINGFWIIGDFAFRYNPQQVEDIGFALKNMNNYQGKPIYIYSESEEAKLEVYVNLGQVAQRVQDACVENKNCSGNFPVKTCEDNFIIIKEGNNNMITQDNNCVYIEGLQEDLTKLTDQFLFKILGIR